MRALIWHRGDIVFGELVELRKGNIVVTVDGYSGSNVWPSNCLQELGSHVDDKTPNEWKEILLSRAEVLLSEQIAQRRIVDELAR